jgi:hypothetical protein
MNKKSDPCLFRSAKIRANPCPSVSNFLHSTFTTDTVSLHSPAASVR